MHPLREWHSRTAPQVWTLRLDPLWTSIGQYHPNGRDSFGFTCPTVDLADGLTDDARHLRTLGCNTWAQKL
jgi:hypothetical protein